MFVTATPIAESKNANRQNQLCRHFWLSVFTLKILDKYNQKQKRSIGTKLIGGIILKNAGGGPSQEQRHVAVSLV